MKLIIKITINCSLKFDKPCKNIFKTGAIAVPKNRMNVFTDRKKPRFSLTKIPTSEIVVGIAKATPLTIMTLKKTNIAKFVKNGIRIKHIEIITNDIIIRFLTPIFSLILPANNAINIPTIPNSLALLSNISEASTSLEEIYL